jgi:hypothetical protein
MLPPHEDYDDLEIKPWDRQEDETPSAWAAFQVYRDMAPHTRALRGAYRAAKGQDKQNIGGTWKRWYKDNQWQARALAYDRHRDAKLRADLESRRLQARIETADLGATLRRKASNAVRMLVAVSQQIGNQNGKEVWVLATELKPNEIASLAKTGVDLEFLALGEPTARIADMSEAEVEAAIARELERLAGGRQAPDAGASPDDAGGATPDA